MARLRQTGSVQDSLGALTIGDGYLLRSDRVAVALIELTPPDLRLYDTDSLTRLLGMYSDVLKTCPDRCSLATFALPLTITPASSKRLRHCFGLCLRRWPNSITTVPPVGYSRMQQFSMRIRLLSPLP